MSFDLKTEYKRTRWTKCRVYQGSEVYTSVMVLGRQTWPTEQNRKGPGLGGGKINFLLKIHEKRQLIHDIKSYVYTIYLYVTKTPLDEKLIYCDTRFIGHRKKIGVFLEKWHFTHSAEYSHLQTCKEGKITVKRKITRHTRKQAERLLKMIKQQENIRTETHLKKNNQIEI